MRLSQLEPCWIRRDGRVVGVRFTCPNNDGPGPHPEGHQVCVLFSNPFHGTAHPDDPSCPGNSAGRRWERTGSTFEDLTLLPSVDCTRYNAACWHGHVRAGDLDGVRRVGE